MTKKAKTTRQTKKKTTANTKAARQAVTGLVAAGEQKRRTNTQPTGTKSGETSAAQKTNAAGGTASTSEGVASKQRWKSLSDAALRALYAEKVGRPTDSTDRRYLTWRIRAAEQGLIPVGPRAPRIRGPKTAVTILFGDQALSNLDETAKADGFKKRLPYLRALLKEALTGRGHADLAEQLGG